MNTNNKLSLHTRPELDSPLSILTLVLVLGQDPRSRTTSDLLPRPRSQLNNYRSHPKQTMSLGGPLLRQRIHIRTTSRDHCAPIMIYMYPSARQGPMPTAEDLAVSEFKFPLRIPRISRIPRPTIYLRSRRRTDTRRVT